MVCTGCMILTLLPGNYMNKIDIICGDKTFIEQKVFCDKCNKDNILYYCEPDDDGCPCCPDCNNIVMVGIQIQDITAS